MKLIRFTIGLLLTCMLLSCQEDDAADIHENDIARIEAYLMEKGLTAKFTDSGLHYIIETELASGDHPTIASTVTVRYKGYFLDGEVFDEVWGTDVISFPLSQVIAGWQEGIPLFSKGSTGTLFIPSALGYGSNPPPGIPPNEVLVFDIELFDF